MTIQSPDSVTTAAPDTFLFPPFLAMYDVSIPDYFLANSSISGLIVGAVVFGGDHVLLIQRAASDFAPLMWEIPGGTCEAQRDPTVLHSLARELWEETGLHLRCIKKLIDEVDFGDDRKPGFTWRKVTFEVEVEEGHGLGPAESKHAITAIVKLDPNEHQDWGWASKKNVEQGKWERGQLQSLELQHATILAAFSIKE
ncbi:hypothetical protein TOPH_06469 [Tolypocladium ophioglossoides CBS 100239]|uniref:Nudix hydrolase domain-containing protein n=1 Tax=Tolypocladium ophioglossoides (strain CBS 100239) TaxID=1163406 RepID=A0A0L0N4B6_TOLOC|nr:hypothetical protein TOPH_06469 [Tolypocladium ophioglossoides CBS 100239]